MRSLCLYFFVTGHIERIQMPSVFKLKFGFRIKCLHRTVMITAATLHTKCKKLVNAIDVQKNPSFTQMWWDPNSPISGLHDFNKIRVSFITEALVDQNNADLNDTKILDVGCGGGILSEALSMCGTSVTGIDVCKEAIHVAIQHRNHNRQLKIKPQYHCTTIEEHATEYKNHYDGVVASEVIEHIDNKELFVKFCVQALKPGGRIFFTTPNKTRLSQIVNIWFAEYVMNRPPRGTHQYSKFITPTDLRFLLERSGCHTENIRGLVFNMLNNTWAWTSSKGLWYAIQAVKE